MKRCDVLIVGGGPAGSSLAWRLRDSGLDVVVMDARAFPRDKVCAGWITPRVIDELQIDTEDYHRGRVLQAIHGFRVGVIDGPSVDTRSSDAPVSYGIRRCEFDHYLLLRSGARLRLGERLEQLTRDGDGWVVQDGLRAGLIVGAGGHFCPVARALGVGAQAEEPAVLAQEVEFEMTPEQRSSCAVDPRRPELYFCRDLEGYGWVLRKDGFLNVGLGREDARRLGDHVRAFRDHLVRLGRIPDSVPRKLRGHAYRLYCHAPSKVVDDGVLLIGDAAGLAYPESGEGIRPAVESALLAGEVIEQAGGDYGAATLARYEQLLRRRFGARQARSGIQRWLPPGLKRFMAGRLLAREWFARRVVLERWFLRQQAPVLGATRRA